MRTARVQVHADHRGGWEVALPDHVRVKCETLDEARSLAFRVAARTQSCDVVVRDAYERVLQHELVDGGGGP